MELGKVLRNEMFSGRTRSSPEASTANALTGSGCAFHVRVGSRGGGGGCAGPPAPADAARAAAAPSSAASASTRETSHRRHCIDREAVNTARPSWLRGTVSLAKPPPRPQQRSSLAPE